MEDQCLFPKGWAGSDDKAYLDEVNSMFDQKEREWLDSAGKPKSCYCCPFAVWYRDYKRCTALRQQLHPCFRINARLKACPVQIIGIEKCSE